MHVEGSRSTGNAPPDQKLFRFVLVFPEHVYALRNAGARGGVAFG